MAAFRPEPMQRLVVISSHGYQKTVIETLHGLSAAHIVEFTETKEGDLAGFRLGRPLAEAGTASEKLVRLRALLRHLGLEGAGAKRVFTVKEIEDRLAEAIFTVEQDIVSAAESKTRLQAALDALAEEESRLRPLSSLPLALDDYAGYQSLASYVGYVDEGLPAELRSVVPDALLFTGEEGLVAAFVPREKAEAARDVLYKHAYRELQPPEGKGSVPDRLRSIENSRADLTTKLASATTALERLREKHGDFLVAAEEHLSIAVSKAEAPLGFASTENAFVVDAWVPGGRVGEVRSALEKATNGNVHIEAVKHVAKAMHGMDDAYGGKDAPHGDHHDEAPQPPTLLKNPGPSKPFQFFTEMFSVPKYDEIDPTLVLSIAFPLFFGFMIGDLGLGLMMVALGWLLFKKLGHVEGLKELGFAILVAGTVASVVGGVVFQDALGMPFGVPGQEIHHLEEEGLLDAHVAGAPVLTAKGAEEFHGVEGAALTCGMFADHVGEWPWTCFAGMRGAEVTVTHPLLVKTQDIPTILSLSLLAGFVHLGLGLLFGLRNEWGHGTKHVAAKFGWLILLVTFFPAVLALMDALPAGITKGTAFATAGIGFLLGGIILGWSEGVVGLLEMPSMLSNILSYLRLGAVAVAKGSMAVAFNNLTLISIGLAPKAGIGLLLVGVVLFIVVQLLLFVLGLLSSGIQAIRLNYVEFFTKFYKGGGEKFKPFGHVRRYSVPGGTVAGGGKL